jgi:arylsulfatase A-like enzyme
MTRRCSSSPSDHGEEFGDHGGVNHGRTLQEEVVRVPLLVRVPGLARRARSRPPCRWST